MGRGLERLQARFEEIQGLEKEGRAGATDGAAQESLDHRVQLRGKRMLSAPGGALYWLHAREKGKAQSVVNGAARLLRA